jgi:hypothetical protein
MVKVKVENSRIYRFMVAFEGRWSPANEVFPIETAEGQLVGSFVIVEGPAWKCFLSGIGYAESLFLGSDTPPYITPVITEGHPTEVTSGAVEKLVVSAKAINDESKRISVEEGRDE